MISHYELRAVLSTWLISSSTLHWCRQRTVRQCGQYRHNRSFEALSEKLQILKSCLLSV